MGRTLEWRSRISCARSRRLFHSASSTAPDSILRVIDAMRDQRTWPGSEPTCGRRSRNSMRKKRALSQRRLRAQRPNQGPCPRGLPQASSRGLLREFASRSLPRRRSPGRFLHLQCKGSAGMPEGSAERILAMAAGTSSNEGVVRASISKSRRVRQLSVSGLRTGCS